MKKIYVDVMINHGTRFYRTIPYEYNPIFGFDFKACQEYVFKKCPTLKYEKGVELWFDN